MTDIRGNKDEPSLEEGIPTFSTSDETLEASLHDFESPIPTAADSDFLRRRKLSSISKLYDVDGDGVLDEYEQALRDMDQSNRGFVSNAKALSLLKEQIQLQKNLLNFKRIIIALSVFTLILALSNLGTAWAAAVLAKDTSVENGALVDRDSHQVLATNDNVLLVDGFVTDDARKPTGRFLETQIYSATVSTMSKTLAQALFTHCPNPAYVDRVFPNGGIHNLQVCPSASSGTTKRTMGGAPTDIYTYDMPDSKQLVVSCPSNQVDCTMSGSALLLPAYLECIDPSDCESNSCSQKLDATFSCDVCNATTNYPCDSLRQCYSMEDIEVAQSLSDANPACLIPVGGDCSNDEYGCLTRECHAGTCRCSPFSGFGCADGETCQYNDALGYPQCV